MATFAETINPCPFNFFTSDPVFQSEADGMVVFVKRSLGDDVLSVELTKKQIWSCFEQATLEYGKYINELQITSQLVNVLGLPTGSDYTLRYPRASLEFLIRQAEPYATEAAVGGSYDAELGYIDLLSGTQDYNIYRDIKVASGTATVPSGSNLWLSTPTGSRGKMRILEVFHFEPTAMNGYFLNSSNLTAFLASEMHYESLTATTLYQVLPVFEDVLRRSAFEENLRVRRSNFSWDILGSNLRIYPVPNGQYQLGRLFVKVFTGQNNPFSPTSIQVSGSFGGDDSIFGISGPSNFPLSNIPYGTITAPGRQWIRDYCLALCKELLGIIRSKMKTIPIPNADLSLNGEDLIAQGREDKDKLRENLKEFLAGLTNVALAEQQVTLSTALQNQLKFVPPPGGNAISIR